ncbi:MAG: PD-(D/E)XK nuclease family protein [Akkermansia sp.]|nr:PD-(D/E)XK nuclease family protein [Akkermansia sp.]
MNTPRIEFLGWNAPAIELVAARLYKGLSDPQTAAQYRRATVVVPTAESGRRLREYMAEQYGPILLPRIILAGQLIPDKGNDEASEKETLAAWLQILCSSANDSLSSFAPLIPQRPETNCERWAVRVAHKLMALRSRLEQEEITYDTVTGVLAKQQENISASMKNLAETDDSLRFTLEAQHKVMQNEQMRWRSLGKIFKKVDEAISRNFPGKITAEQSRAEQIEKARGHGASGLIILACVPELSPQLQRYLSNLHNNKREVHIWINAPEEESESFDAFGCPVIDNWSTREIVIPDAFVYTDETMQAVDTNASTIHITDDAEAMAEEALRLAGGHTSREVAIAVGDAEFSPSILSSFAAKDWQLNMPEGRSALTTDLGRLAMQLTEACTAREKRAFFNEGADIITNNDTQGLDAYVALLCNTSLQKVLADSPEQLAGLHEHIERIRMLLLPGSEQALLQMIKQLPPVDAGYKSIDKLKKQQNAAYGAYADTVSALVDKLCNDSSGKTLKSLANAIENRIGGESGGIQAAHLARHIRNCADIASKLPSPLCTMEVLRHTVAEKSTGPAIAERAYTVGDLLGWRELAYTNANQVIIAAMHDGCIPEPVPQDDFLPASLCDELGIRHDKFRIARDSYLLTALIAGRRQTGGRVDFILARQNSAGAVLAPSSLLMRCGTELPRRARTLFTESKKPKKLPPAQPCPIRRSTGGQKRVSAGELESISIIAGDRKNPYAVEDKPNNSNTYTKSFSPSSLSTFLQCPLTFWIKNLFNIDLGDTYKEYKGELESNEFGTVMHAVLDKLVAAIPSEDALYLACPDAKQDEAAAIDYMLQVGKEIAADEWQTVYNSLAQRNKQALPMEVQQQAIERLLTRFVIQHRKDLADGWYNVAREYTLEPTLEYAEGQFARFYMNADRVDRNRDGRWRIIDYKTSNNEKKPHDVHFDQLEERKDSRYIRFMNVQGYEFGTIYIGGKLCRWRDVQLPLYAYGLRNPSLKDREVLGIPAGANMTQVIPDLLYYNIQSKIETLEVYPLVLSGEVQPISEKVKDVPSYDEMFESAMKTVKASIQMIRNGVCLFSAESLNLKNKPYSALNKPGSNAPRFGNLTLQSDPRNLFALPELDI